MKISNEKLKELLVLPGHIPEADFEFAEKQANDKNIPLKNVLVDNEMISNEQLGRLVADDFGYKFVNLSAANISEEIIRIIPEMVARNQQIIVFDKTKEGLKVAMADPSNFEMIEWLERKTGEKIIPYYATLQGIQEALKYYRQELGKTYEEIIKDQAERIQPGKPKTEKVPIITTVNAIVEAAYENGASDIHIEPLEKEVQIRFRIDGVLHNVLTLPKTIHALVVTRVKVLSKLRTDEHFAAQDGKFAVKLGKEKFDVRVSIVPVTEGEKVVMRLLSERSRQFPLKGLGLVGRDLKKVRAAIKKPYGMILATGPTGCGKTTTLYAILKILNTPKVNIATIEDPVEYDIAGVNQIQVNPKTDLTFAKGLRSIVRQDPDIIMVGEIRDEETAGIAVNSAMTGHLVLSTMHASTAATNLPRLMDMGIEPFLIASSVNVIVAQRLVRKICTKCRQSHELTRKELEKMELSDDLIRKFLKGKPKARCYHGKGCQACSKTGYSGRIGIFEILDMTDDVQKLIMEKANADQVQEQAVKEGMTTMAEDGIQKVLSGLTTLEEVVRVTRE